CCPLGTRHIRAFPSFPTRRSSDLDLAQIGSLKVISRTSSMQYKQSKKSLPEIARELNVDGIVEGTVQRSGDRVRITAQLIQVQRSEEHTSELQSRFDLVCRLLLEK